MAIDFDAVGTPTAFNGETSKTWSHTVSGTNRMLLVGIGTQGGSPTVVTYNDVSLGLIRTAAQGSVTAWLYGLVAPDTGTHDVVVTFGSGVNGGTGSISLTGVDQTTPVEADNGATGNGGTMEVAVTASDDSWVVDSFVHNGAASLTAGDGQDERYEVGNSGAHNALSTEGPVAAGSVTMSWTGGSNQWAIVAAAIKSDGEALPPTGSGAVTLPRVSAAASGVVTPPPLPTWRNNATTTNSTTATDRTISGNRTVAAGTGMLVAIVRLHDANDIEESGNSGTITGATINSVSFTAVPGLDKVLGDGDNLFISAWYIVDPPIGVNLAYSFTTDSQSDSSSITWIEIVPNDSGNTLAIGEVATPAVGTTGTNVGGQITTEHANSIVIAAAIGFGGDTDPFTPDADITEELSDGASGTSTTADHGHWTGAANTAVIDTYDVGCTQAVSDGFAWIAFEIYEEAGGETYEEEIDLAAELGLTTAATLSAQAVVVMAADMDVAHATLLTAENAVTLALAADMDVAGAAVIDRAASFAVALALENASGLSIAGDISLAVALDQTVTATLTIPAAALFAAELDIAAAAQLDAEAALSFDVTLNLATAGALIILAEIALALDLAVTTQAANTAEEAVAFAVDLALSAAAGRDLDETASFGALFDIASDSIFVLTNSISLGAQFGVTTARTANVSAEILLAVLFDVAANTLLTAEAEALFGVGLDYQQATQLLANAAAEFGIDLDLTAQRNVDHEVAVTLAAFLGGTASAPTGQVDGDVALGSRFALAVTAALVKGLAPQTRTNIRRSPGPFTRPAMDAHTRTNRQDATRPDQDQPRRPDGTSTRKRPSR